MSNEIKAGDRCVFWDEYEGDGLVAEFYGDGHDVLSVNGDVIKSWNFCRSLPSNLCSEVSLGDKAEGLSIKQYKLLLAAAEMSLYNPEVNSLREAYTNLKKELDL